MWSGDTTTWDTETRCRNIINFVDDFKWFQYWDQKLGASLWSLPYFLGKKKLSFISSWPGPWDYCTTVGMCNIGCSNYFCHCFFHDMYIKATVSVASTQHWYTGSKVKVSQVSGMAGFMYYKLQDYFICRLQDLGLAKSLNCWSVDMLSQVLPHWIISLASNIFKPYKRIQAHCFTDMYTWTIFLRLGFTLRLSSWSFS